METSALLELHGWTVVRIWEHVSTDEAAARAISTARDRGVYSRSRLPDQRETSG